jgi:hypothetical protein
MTPVGQNLRQQHRSDGLKPLLLIVVGIAAFNLAWCLTPSNNSPFAPLSAAISILVLCLVPAAWKMNTRALAWLAAIHFFVGVIYVYRLWPHTEETWGILIALPLAIAWSLWAIRRRGLSKLEFHDRSVP